tara:strand:+ start:845 stop:1726 length:882 start_codon:yes stop_codon:yes gene_type:complete
MIVPDQKNMKVHFAGSENQAHYNVLKALEVKYSLYTAYPFLERMLYGKGKFPIIANHLKKEPYKIPQHVINTSKHTIQDSGLFSLMFGARAGNHDQKFLDQYYEKLIEFTTNYSQGATIVEMDTQKILGVESAWRYREKLRKDVPNRIINVFHIEDGEKGLDRLIEYSDYIAISVPELRKVKKKNHLLQLANYIKNKKPEIDIHLLGFTEKKNMKALNFCSSCDSTSYNSGVRYGFVQGRKISEINNEKVRSLVTNEHYVNITKYVNDMTAGGLILNIKSELHKYEKLAGSQD